jgi:hypothetical protein
MYSVSVYVLFRFCGGEDKPNLFLINLAYSKNRTDLEYTGCCIVDPKILGIYCANVDTLLLHVRSQLKNILKGYIRRLLFPKLIMTTVKCLTSF